MLLPATKQFLLDLFKFWMDVNFISSSHPRARKEGKLLCGDIADFLRKYKNKHNQRKLSNVVNNLKRTKLIEVPEGRLSKGLIITAKGIELLTKTKTAMFNLPLRKDDKTLMVLFDITENKRKIRDIFRRELKFLGYEQLQKSVWLSSYDVFKATKDILKKYKLTKEVHILLVDKPE